LFGQSLSLIPTEKIMEPNPVIPSVDSIPKFDAGMRYSKNVTSLLQRQRTGFLVLCAKSDECGLWMRRAEKAGRLSDVRRFAVDQPHRLNLLDYAYQQPGAVRGGADPSNVVELLMKLLEVKPNRSSTGEQVFWVDSARNLLTAAVSILGAANERLSFGSLEAVIDSAPYAPEEMTNPKWQESSFLNLCLDKLAEHEKDLTPIQQNDARVSLEFFANKFARMDERTRSGILATVQSIIWPFRYGPAAELCGNETNLTPEDIFRGRIVILDLPIKQYHDSGLMIQACWKLLFQRAAESRDLNLFPWPVVLYIDEAHHFVTSYDPIFQSTARSSRVATVLLSQNLDSLRSRFPSHTGEAEAQSVIANLGTKILCANDHAATNKWAADAIGEQWLTRSNASATMNGEGTLSAGTGTNESKRYRVEPSDFLKLRKGGPPDNMVDCILFRSGTPFKATGTNHLRLTFPQG
jgi:type IV secretory pathway TraG/TraD family ATPase VirD4